MQFFEFIRSNASMLVATIALIISLRASSIARSAYKLNLRKKEDEDRLMLAEKRRELLNAIDRQNTALATLSFVTAEQIIVFAEWPKLNDILPEELARLHGNLATVETLQSSYEDQRNQLAILTDIPAHEESLSEVLRLNIHLEKDIAHERALLTKLRNLAETAPSA